jgi:predicted transcriptional regulator of viral defense system
MKWEELLQIVGKESVFRSSLLKTGPVDPVDIGRQLSRWVKSGKLIQFRKGLYSLSEKYRKTAPHPFYVANRLKRGSYVSLQSALEHYGLIPEYVPNIVCVTTGRPETVSTPLWTFIFKHIKSDMLFGYSSMDIGEGQKALIAHPEKALLDLLYLTPGSDNLDYLHSLRLQNADVLNLDRLKDLSHRAGSRKLFRATVLLEALLEEKL